MKVLTQILIFVAIAAAGFFGTLMFARPHTPGEVTAEPHRARASSSTIQPGPGSAAHAVQALAAAAAGRAPGTVEEGAQKEPPSHLQSVMHEPDELNTARNLRNLIVGNLAERISPCYRTSEFYVRLRFSVGVEQVDEGGFEVTGPAFDVVEGQLSPPLQRCLSAELRGMHDRLRVRPSPVLIKIGTSFSETLTTSFHPVRD